MANYDASSIINAAYAQVTGSSALDDISVEDIIDQGVASGLFETQIETFTKALIEQCAKMFFTDASYTENYEDPYFVDSRRFASVLEVISVESPAVVENPAWRALTSGTSTVGSYTVVLPTLDVRTYCKSDSYAINITISGQRWNDCVRSADELIKLVDYIFLSINNAILQHKEDLQALNRATLIAQLLQADADVSDTGVHKIELRAAYNAARSKSITTAAAFMADPDAMRWAAKTIALYCDYIKKQSTLFNVGGKVKFVPRDRLVLEMNTGFDRSIREVALSDAFMDDLISASNYHTVPYWQAEVATNALDFEATTSIDIDLDDKTEIKQSGIVALLADRYSLLHTIREERIGHQRFDVDDLDLYSFQHRDSYLCNASLPALVFTLEDAS